MSEKKRKFEADLTRLVDQGNVLYDALRYEYDEKGLRESLAKDIVVEEIEQIMSGLPGFSQEYQQWYSEASALVRQVLPDRLQDFKSYYEYPRARKKINFENYRIKDCLRGITVRGLIGYDLGVLADGSAAIPEFKQQLAIVKAAKDVLNSSLRDLRQILQADLFDSEIDSARGLAKAGHLRAAGVICGVVIEKHLGQVCNDHSIPVGQKNPTISDLNEALKKSEVFDVPVWRRIQHLADIRNLCGHNRKREPTKDEIDDLLNGTDYVIKSVF